MLLFRVNTIHKRILSGVGWSSGSGCGPARPSLDQDRLSCTHPSQRPRALAWVPLNQHWVTDHRERWAAVPVRPSLHHLLLSSHITSPLKLDGSCLMEQHPLCVGGCLWKCVQGWFLAWIQVLILSTVGKGLFCPEGRNKVTMAHAAPLSKGEKRVCRPQSKKENGCYLAGRGGDMTLCLVRCRWSKAFHALKLSHWPTAI